MQKRMLGALGAALVLGFSANAFADYLVISENGYCAVFRSEPGNFETNYGLVHYAKNPNWVNATCKWDSEIPLDRAYVTHKVDCTITLGFWDDPGNPEVYYRGEGHATIDDEGEVSIKCKAPAALP